MNIKMKVEKNKNIKNKIGLKNFFISKNKQPFKPKNINIQTINVLKNFDNFNEDKNIFSAKNMKNIRYLNNINNYQIIPNNDYFINKNRNSFFNSFDSERFPSPINSVGSSSNIPSGKKKFKKRRYHRKKLVNKKNKYNNNSIQNLSFNTNKSDNINISFINSSSSSSDSYDDINNINNNYSESSENSYKSRENKRKKYFEKMMVEENELDYLKRSEVGLIPTDDEDNNNSIDNSNSIEENFSNEIEKILIEIYNKNISLISSIGNNYYEVNKNYSDIEDIEKQIKKYLKRENLKTNLLVLKSLGNKIKELIGKYKEKIFEIEELKKYQVNIQRQLILNEQFIRCNNSLESNVATTNSNSNSYYDEENFFIKNNLILNPDNERNEKGISHILIRELINIKRTLKISSKEIEGIFKYPLSILKENNGKKKKFSVELMQREEFCKIILNDEIIFNLLNQVKEIFYKNKYSEINKWLLELDENYEHKNEMSKFMEYINDKLLMLNEEQNIINNNDNNNENENEEIKKKIKKKRNKKIENNEEKKQEEEIQFKDIDEILNYINNDNDNKKPKKKGKKNKKNKNKKKEEEKINNINNDEHNNNEDNIILDNNFDNEFENFKEDIIKNSLYLYEINTKIKPCLSDAFLKKISIM
jgi:hypothetical protein